MKYNEVTPHISVFFHTCPHSLAFSRDKKQTIFWNPLAGEMNSKDSCSLCSLLHSYIQRCELLCDGFVMILNILPKF